MGDYSVLSPNSGMKSELILSAISIIIVVIVILALKSGIKKRAEKQGKEEKHPLRVILKWYYILIAIAFPFYLWFGHESHNNTWAGAFLIGVPIGVCLGTIGGGWIDTLVSIIKVSILSALVLHFGKVIPIFNNNFETIINTLSSIAFIISAIAMFRSKGDLLRKQEKIEFTGYVGDYTSWSSDGQRLTDNGDIEAKKNYLTGNITYINKNTGQVIGTGRKGFFNNEIITDTSGNTITEKKGMLGGSTYTDSNGNVVFKKEKDFIGDTVIKDSNGNTIYKGEDNIFSDNITFKKK